MAHSTVLSKHLYYFHFLLQGKVSLFLHVVGSHFALDVTRGDGWSLSAHALPCPAVQSRMRSVSDKAGRCVVSIDSIMASQAVSGSGLEVFEIHSYIRGYHAYIGLWTPTIGEVLLVKPEPTNEKDSNAVAVLKEDSIVGHVPRNLSLRLFHFLRRDVNKAFAEVTGQKVNRGAGYGLEIPCTYRLYGPPAYINKMKELVESLAASGHI